MRLWGGRRERSSRSDMTTMHLLAVEETNRKKSYPCARQLEHHDFRKEFKQSVLYASHQRPRDSFWGGMVKTVSGWANHIGALSRKSAAVQPQGPSLFQRLPNELLERIFSHVDSKSALSCRAVCRRFRHTVDSPAIYDRKFAPITISRLIISGNGRKGLQVRRVAYGTQRAQVVTVTQNQLNNGALFFNFRRFNVQRIIIKDLCSGQFTDSLVEWLRCVLCGECPVQLSLAHIDLSASSAVTLHVLLAVCGKSLEIFEMQQLSGARADSVTDEHMSQLDAARVRRITIDGVRFASRRTTALALGNDTLMMFMCHDNFPTLVLDRCSVTTKMVCEYTQRWLASHHDSDQPIMRSQVCTVKRCSVKGDALEKEMGRRGLHCTERRPSDTLTLYHVRADMDERDVSLPHEFTVAVCPVDDSVEQPIEKAVPVAIRAAA